MARVIRGPVRRNVEYDDIRVTSPIQTYLDVLGFRGRGEEAAETILREVIEPTW